MKNLICLGLLFCSVWASAQKDTIRIDGSTGVRPLVVALAEAFEDNYRDIKVIIGPGMNTSKRIEELQKGTIDIAMASHGLDIARFTQQGLQVHWFSKMAIVMGVNQSVKVKNIEFDEICAIYAQTFINWQALGGNYQDIRPLFRPITEVDTEVLMARITCLKEHSEASHLQVFEKSGPMAKALATQTGAIGMTTLVRVAQSKGQIKALKIDGVKANKKNLVSGKYPFSRNSYLITKGLPNPTLKRFMLFVNSRSGRKVIERNYAVPVQ